MALPFKWKLVFHVMYVPMGLSRVGWAALRGKTILAKTLLLSLCDGYRGIGGKWKYHDQ
jgi:hypothetical protein